MQTNPQYGSQPTHKLILRNNDNQCLGIYTDECTGEGRMRAFLEKLKPSPTPSIIKNASPETEVNHLINSIRI